MFAISEYIRKSGATIIARKGATYNGVAAAVANICKGIYLGLDNIICLSVLLKGEYGINDVCISIPTIIGRNGIVSTLTPTLSAEEQELLVKSANAMKAVIDQINE